MYSRWRSGCIVDLLLQELSSFEASLRQLQYGPMLLKKKSMSVLLVFPQGDQLLEHYLWAANAGGYSCDTAQTDEAAMQLYQDKLHSLVIIDARENAQQGEKICRALRSSDKGDHCIIVSVTPKYSQDVEEPSVQSLINTGFNRRLPAGLSRTECLNELMLLEHNDVKIQAQLIASRAFVIAAERCVDPIDIVSDEFEYQYTNPAFEKLTGYTRDDLLGKDARALTLTDRRGSHPESQNNRLHKGKAWDGLTFVKTKTGEVVGIQGSMTPVYGINNTIEHWVTVRRHNHSFLASTHDKANDSTHINGTVPYHSSRRESIARLNSMNTEAPITKVISMISAAQENSPATVAQALDKVLDILRSTELYSPYLSPNVKDDKMTQDYVGGLLATGFKSTSSMIAPYSRTCPQTGIPQHSFVSENVPDTVKQLLDKETEWSFNIVELEELTDRKVMRYLCLKIFQRFRVCEYLNIPEIILINWLQMIESHYHSDNPYHNSTHASDVAQATAYFLRGDRMKAVMNNVDEVASLLAAVVHDLDHPGRTNPFLVNSNHHLALLYNDQAVLESHHVSLAYRLTCDDERVNIFKNLTREDYRSLRQQIVDMVLATEMSKHFEHLNKFISGINNSLEENEFSGRNSPASLNSIAKLATPDNKKLIKRMMIKCADVANPVRPLSLCIEWAKRISEEYFRQTDDEKSRGLPVVMPQFDRHTCNMPKSQIGFTDLFIKDMFEAWHEFCDVPELMEQLQRNYEYWEKQHQQSEQSTQLDGPST